MTISSKHIQSFWSLRSSLCHNVYLFSTWVKKDFHFFSEHFLFLTNFFSRELTCWAFLLARTFAMFSLHSTDSANIASYPDFLLPKRNAIFSRKVSNVPRLNNFLQTQGNIFHSWKKIMYTLPSMKAGTNYLASIKNVLISVTPGNPNLKKWKLLSCNNFQQLVGGRESNGTF